MSAQPPRRADHPRVTWRAAKQAVRDVRPPPATVLRLRFRPAPPVWFGRCPAFRPPHPNDEKRGRLAHAAD